MDVLLGSIWSLKAGQHCDVAPVSPGLCGICVQVWWNASCLAVWWKVETWSLEAERVNEFPKVLRMLLVAMPGAPSSVLAPSSKARSP